MGDDPSQPSVSNTNHRKEMNRSRFDRFVRKVGQKLLPKPCDTIFVPSSIASVGTALPELSIDTFGGEAAGSGYGWINTPGVGEPYHGVESVIKAQQLGLQMVNERIEWTKEQIDLCCSDEKMIAEFVAEAFVEELNAIRNKSDYLALRESVKRLENEINELRQLSPKSMSTVVDQLVDMGFDRVRVEYAYEQTGKGPLEVVMDWLISHEEEEIPPPQQTTETADVGKSTETKSTRAHLKILTMCFFFRCNKLFRDENGMMFHAAKSGHENFSESTETVASLTPEERAKKAAELRERIKIARAQKEEAERKEEIEKERRRREEGKKMLEVKQKQRENELRALLMVFVSLFRVFYAALVFHKACFFDA
ncbi:unnamed protein product [Angiostrongylus costaricensis]|uniref:UBA domain-containing protein n=1 Tax=Angiostrongylus costaricensis TaxID=334426 RepID=A0A0R3PJ46_ANGCS|nr:unnamed protein product [Angiostrongylus costaricensis]